MRCHDVTSGSDIMEFHDTSSVLPAPPLQRELLTPVWQMSQKFKCFVLNLCAVLCEFIILCSSMPCPYLEKSTYAVTTWNHQFLTVIYKHHVWSLQMFFSCLRFVVYERTCSRTCRIPLCVPETVSCDTGLYKITWISKFFVISHPTF